MIESLNLDPAVRTWVFLPLTFCIVLMKLLQQYAHMLMNPMTPPPSKKSSDEIREMQLVQRSQRLRMFGRVIPETGFRMRKEYFVGKDTGVFHQKSKGKSMQEQMATNPDMLSDMVKKNLTGMIPQLAMGFFVNFFFSGFVMGRVPFPLSPRFKPMLQRGIDLVGLDVTYFTALSYYILLLFGLQGVFSLVFREQTLDNEEMMKRQMNPMNNNPMFDAQQAFKGEVQGLTNLDHEFELNSAEERAVAVLKRSLGLEKP